MSKKTKWLSYAFSTTSLTALLVSFPAKNYSETNEMQQHSENDLTTTINLDSQNNEVDSLPISLIANRNEIAKAQKAPPEDGPARKGSLLSQVEALSARIDKISAENAHGQMSGYLAPHVPCCGFTMKGEFLYWKANEDGLEYGTKMIGEPIIGQPSETITRLHDVKFKWNPGFRIGAGYRFDRFDFWSLDLTWTHIRNRASGSDLALAEESQVGPLNTIVSPWVNLLFELRAGAQSATAKWRVDFDTLDLSLSRSFFVTKRLALNPFFGFRGTRINQHYKAIYDSVFLLGESGPLFSRDVTFIGKNDFGGFGIQGGSDFIFQFAKNWNLFAKFSGGLTYGKFNVKIQNLNDQGLGEGMIAPMPLDFKAAEHFWRTRFNFEEAIGFAWEMFYNKDKFHVSINAAYEMSQWLSQNQLFSTFYFRGQDTISSVPIRSQGDLGFQGIRIGAQFDF